jgi:hypothetical protein
LQTVFQWNYTASFVTKAARSTKKMAVRDGCQGGTLAAYGYGLLRYGGGTRAGGLTFNSLMLGQLLHVYFCRSRRRGLLSKGKRNRKLGWRSCYIRVADMERLFKEFVGNGTPVKQPAVRPWGTKELYVIDPHGNLLKFGEAV